MFDIFEIWIQYYIVVQVDSLIANRYKLIRPVSTGGMGEVWEAIDTRESSHVALKALHGGTRGRDVDTVLRFRKEAEILRGLSHENIVKIRDSGEWGSSYYLVMDFVEGKSLKRYLEEEGPLPLQTFYKIALELARTVRFCHEHHILHGDLKPGNVMIQAINGTVKLKVLDFGVAIIQDRSGAWDAPAVGTFAYMAPERSGVLARPIDQRSDLYSLGVIFYELLSGKPPFSAHDVFSIIHKHIASEPDPIAETRPDLPKMVCDIVARLLRKDARERYPHAGELVADLEAARDGRWRDVLGDDAWRRAIDGLESGRLAFGRSDELAELENAMWRAEEGDGCAIAVYGEAGSGKTRLVTEAQLKAVRSGGYLLSHDFSESRSSGPLGGVGSLIEMFFWLLSLKGEGERAIILRGIEEEFSSYADSLEAAFPGFAALRGRPHHEKRPAPPIVASFEGLAYRLLLAFERFLPFLVVCFDRADLADSMSLRVMDRLARAARGRKLVVIATSRPGGFDPGETWRAMELAPLDEATITVFLESKLRFPHHSALTAAPLIVEGTEGHPSRLVKALLGASEHLRRAMAGDASAYDAVIESLRASLPARGMPSRAIEYASLLDEGHRAVIERIFAFRRPVSLGELLQCFPEIGMEAALGACARASSLGIVSARGHRYAAASEAASATVLDAIPLENRRAIHDRIAAFLESRKDESVDASFESLEHWRLAGKEGRRRAALECAAGKAYALGSYGRAIELYRELLATEAAAKPRRDLLERFGDSAMALGLHDEARSAYLRLLDAEDDPARRSELLWRLIRVCEAEGKFSDALRFAKQLLGIYGASFPSGPSLFVRLAGNVIKQFNHRVDSPKIRMVPMEEDSAPAKLHAIYEEIALVGIWSMRLDVLFYAHCKAMNLVDAYGISRGGIVTLLTHCAALVSVAMPSYLVPLAYRRAYAVLRRVARSLELLGSPAPHQALYLAVKAAIDCGPGSLDLAREAMAIAEADHGAELLQEISICAAQAFEFLGSCEDLLRLARFVRKKASLGGNEKLRLLARLYGALADYLLCKNKAALADLPGIASELDAMGDTTSAQYARIFLVRAAARAGRFALATEAGLAAIESMRKSGQTHPLVMSRVYAFLLESHTDRLRAYRSDMRQRVSAISRAETKLCARLYRKTRSLGATYRAHRLLAARVEAKYLAYVLGDEEAAIKRFEASAALAEGYAGVQDRALYREAYATILEDRSPDAALMLLEKAYLDYDTMGSRRDALRVRELMRRIGGDDEPIEAEKIDASSGSSSQSAIRELKAMLDAARRVSQLAGSGYSDMLEHVMRLSGAQQAELYLAEEGRPRCVARACADGVTVREAPMGIIAMVELSGAPVLLEDASRDGLFRSDPQVLSQELKSVLCVPLMSGSERLGCVYLAHHGLAGAFNEHTKALVEGLASQAASAIDNARLRVRAREISRHLNELLDAVPIAIIALDADAKPRHRNKEAVALYPRLSRLGSNDSVWSLAPSLLPLKESFEKVSVEGVRVDVGRIEIGDSVFAASISPLPSEEAHGAVLALQDVTMEERMQRQLVQSQKMEAVGTLVGGIAHDFNNILMGILATAQVLEEELPLDKGEDSASREDLRVISSSAKRAADLVKQLMGLSASHAAQRIPVDLDAAVDEVLKFARKSFDKGVAIRWTPSRERCFSLGDPAQVEQVILNVLINAAHSMTIMRSSDESWGGTIEVSLEELRDEDRARVPGLAPEPHWVLAVSDEGVGMDEKELDRIFEPFYTTKSQGKGTGLGLSMVYSLMRRMGGAIDVRSTPGKGSCFRLIFPASEPPADESRERNEECSKCTGRVLVVEDEEVVRGAVLRYLQRSGLEAVASADGEDATRAFKDEGPFDLVVLDLVMPRRSGRFVYHEIRSHKPDQPILLVSGFPKDERIDGLLEEGHCAFLQKPFRLEDLARVIKGLVG